MRFGFGALSASHPSACAALAQTPEQPNITSSDQITLRSFPSNPRRSAPAYEVDPGVSTRVRPSAKHAAEDDDSALRLADRRKRSQTEPIAAAALGPTRSSPSPKRAAALTAPLDTFRMAVRDHQTAPTPGWAPTRRRRPRRRAISRERVARRRSVSRYGWGAGRAGASAPLVGASGRRR